MAGLGSTRTAPPSKAETYLKYLHPSYLRYYYAAKLGPRLEDLDLNLKDFANKIYADLVGKVVNLASRTAKFAHQTGLSAKYPDDGGLFAQAAAAGEEIAAAYELCDFNRAMRMILELANRANPYVETQAPWVLNKDPNQVDKLQDVCTVALNLFRQLAIYLAPVLPRLARQTGELLCEPITDWEQAQTPLLNQSINKFQHMLKRVDPKKVQAMAEESKQEVDVAQNSSVPAYQDSDQPLKDEPLADEITFDDFTTVDLRVVRVLAAEDVAEARKLLKLTLGLGGQETRTVFAGIKQAYEPEQLVGKLVVMVANLASRQMRFGLSEGMIIASGAGGSDVFLLTPDEGALPGQRVH